MDRLAITLCACLAGAIVACADGVAPEQTPEPPPPPGPGGQLPDKPTPPSPPPAEPEPGAPPEDPGPDTPPEDPGPDSPPPETGPGCGEVDFLGKCEGNVAVWCQDDELLAYDCSIDGQACRFIDDQIGYFCVEVGGGDDERVPDLPPDEMPPEDMPPDGQEPVPELPPPEGQEPDAPPADPCPGVDALGRCDGTVNVWCDNNEEILSFDCALLGWVCMDLGLLGHRCVPPDQNGGQQPGG